MIPSKVLLSSLFTACVLAAAGCGSSTSDSAGGDGTAGEPGTGGSATTGGTGGGSTAGTGGDATGGTAGAAGSGAAPADYWGAAFVAGQLPNPADGNHNAGQSCAGCHSSGDAAWLFGGTVYQADGTTGAASVEIGVRDGANVYTAYSATNGNFWFPSTGGTVDWANADVRMRNGTGEATMTSTATGNCNSCHTGGMALVEP